MAVMVIVGVVAMTAGGSSAPNTRAEAEKSPQLAEPEKTFKRAPEGCRLLEAKTLARIAPEAQCTPSELDDAPMTEMITRMPRWEPAGADALFQSLDVHLTIGSGAKSSYEMKKESAHTALKDVRKTTDSRSLDDLGDRAHMVYAVDREPFDLAEATVIVNEGNAILTIAYTYALDSGTTEQQSEQRAVTAARDVLESLS